MKVSVNDEVLLSYGKGVRWSVTAVKKYWDVYDNERAQLHLVCKRLGGLYMQRKWIDVSEVYGVFTAPEKKEA